MYNASNITTIYVSQKDGSDMNEGLFPEKNSMLTGPLETIEYAIKHVADMRRSGAIQPITIKVVGDEYLVKNTIVIDNSVSYLTIEPMKKTLLSGGFRVDNFKEDVYGGVSCLSADLSAYGDIKFSDFYVNGKRADLTRYPESGTLEAEDVEDLSTKLFAGSKWFIAPKKDFDAISSFKNLDECIISFGHYWVDEHTGIEEIDPETRKIVFKKRSRFTIEPVNPRAKLNYIVENVAEMLKNPGEWYFDKESKKLYYIPKNGENAENIVGYVPLVSELIRFEGTAEEKLKNVTVRGFDMAYTKGEALLVGGGEAVYASDTQSVADTAAAIEMIHTYSCGIEDCNIFCTGLHSVGIRGGCSRNRLVGNDIKESGAGGIVINSNEVYEEGTDKTYPDRDVRMQTYGNLISDNKIIGVGRRYAAGCGILIKHSYENTVSHNEVADTCYTGISCGWIWGYGESITHDNRIEKNHIYNIGGKQLSDMGGVYLLGIQKGTVVSGNLIHDVKGEYYGGWALYADEGTSGVLFENNICYNTSENSFHVHYGHANTVRNNIFAFAKDEILANSRSELHVSAIYERNIVVTNGQRALRVGYNDECSGCLQIAAYNNNIFYDLKNKEPKMIRVCGREYSFEEFEKELNLDTASICADPKFADIDSFDFNLAENSPATEYGFKPIDMSDVGVRNKK